MHFAAGRRRHCHGQTPEDEPPTPVKSEELRERIAQINRENKSKKQQKQIRKLENKHLPKPEEYEQKPAACGDRNSCSKSDPDATFMRMKEDAMNNGQLKAGYNLQIVAENQFIASFDFYPDPTDTLTLPAFLELHESRYGAMPDKAVADAGYGSEENYAFMEKHQIEAYVKYSCFHREQKRSRRNNPFPVDNLYYNREEDYFVCPPGQHITLAGTGTRTSKSGYRSQVHTYRAGRCAGCPCADNAIKHRVIVG